MSLFKTRDVWTAVVGENESFDIGCVCIADVDNSGNSKIIVGSYSGYLRVYSPSVFDEESNFERDYGVKPGDLMCEIALSDPILQIEAGRFVSGSEKLAVMVLHSKKFTTYLFTSHQGAGDALAQCQLAVAYEHKLKRNAFNFCCGAFGGIKGRDHVCVQSMDGVLSVFEQEVFAFSRFLPNSLIPGPIEYVRSTDCFVTVSSCRRVECYKLQKLALSPEVASTSDDASGKKVTAEWTFNIDENAKDIFINRSKLSTSIFILGERNLYAFSEQGQLTFMKKFDFEPSSFFVYSASDTSEEANILLTTHSRTLLVYSNTTLKWAAQLGNVPVQILRANFGKYRGMIVTLDDEGHLNCSYLGTNPTVFSRSTVAEEREVDYMEAQAELKQLQAVIKEKQNLTGSSVLSRNSKRNSSDAVELSLVLQKFDTSLNSDAEGSTAAPSVLMNVLLHSRISFKNIRVSIRASSAYDVSPSTFTVHNIDASRPVENHVEVSMKRHHIPTSMFVRAVATYQTQHGTLNTIKQSLKLPSSLVPCDAEKTASNKLTIRSNKPSVHLKHLYPDCFAADEASDSAGSVVAFRCFAFRCPVSVLASRSSNKYRIQSEHLSSMWLVVEDFIDRLKRHSPDIELSFDRRDVPLQELFVVIDRHFELRMEKRHLEKMLETTSTQLRAVQKRLLLICRDKTPQSFSNLDILLEMTHRQIIDLADRIEAKNAELVKVSSELSNAVCLVLRLLQLSFDLDDHEVDSLASALSTDVELADAAHGWEEIVECNVTHLLRTSLSKNVKDVVVSQTTLARLDDVGKLKRHLKTLYERMCGGARPCDSSIETIRRSDASGERIAESADVSSGLKRDTKPQFHRRELESLNEEAAEAENDGDDNGDDDDGGDDDGGDDDDGDDNDVECDAEKKDD